MTRGIRPDEEAVAAFLTHLANAGSANAATQNQASSALLFLYRTATCSG